MPRHILADRNLARLRDFAASGALLGFDFDGTLAPLHAQPADAAMRPATLELLESLAHCAPVTVVTGRSVSDVRPRLGDATLLAVVGNHGIEPSAQEAEAAAAVAAWVPALQLRLARFRGTWIENKRFSVTVHYRDAAQPRRVVHAVTELMATLPAAGSVVPGIAGLNLIPAGVPNKGDALMAIMRTHALPGALFVGDEHTDESAFEAVNATGGISVHVGARGVSAAEFRLDHQDHIDDLLAELLAGRSRRRARSGDDEPSAPREQPVELTAQQTGL